MIKCRYVIQFSSFLVTCVICDERLRNVLYFPHFHFLFDCQVLLCRRFQITLFEVLIHREVNKLEEVLKGLELGTGVVMDYFLLPAIRSRSQPSIDWEPISSVLFSYKNEDHFNCSSKGNAHVVHTKGGPVCTCALQNSLVCTPHNGSVYFITGASEDLNGRSLLKLRDGSAITYKEHYAKRYCSLIVHRYHAVYFIFVSLCVTSSSHLIAGIASNCFLIKNHYLKGDIFFQCTII